MLGWQAFLDVVDRQAKLQAQLAELAMDNCLASSQAFFHASTDTHREELSSESRRKAPEPQDVPFGSITIEYEDDVATACVHVDVIVADEAFQPAAETRLVMDFKHEVDVRTESQADVAARSRAMLIHRLRSAADLLESVAVIPAQ